MAWAATEAKAKFSEMLDKAEEDGPQRIRRRKQEFYVVTQEQWEHIQRPAEKTLKSGKKKAVGTLGEFFRKSPLAGSDIQIKRLNLRPRHIEL